MKRYLRLYWLLMRQKLLLNLEYRLDFLFHLARSVGWLLLSIFFFWVLFGNVNKVANWGFYEVLLVYGTYQLVFHTLTITAWGSLAQLPPEIRHGELDQFLTKPVHPQFSLTARDFDWGEIANWLSGLAIIAVAMRNLQLLSTGAVAVYLLIILAAIVIFYALFLILVTTAFWWLDLYNLDELFQSMIGLGRVPSSIYPDALRISLTFIIPAAFVGTIPAESLVRFINWGNVVYGVSAAILLLWLSNKFFQFGLKHYSSASS